MLSSTLKEYQKNCNANLQAFLDEYEDNTKTFFLQGEIAKYKAYQKSLTDISSKLSLYTKEELQRNPISSSVASKLKKLNPKAYEDIVSVILIKMDFDEVDGDFLLPGAIPSLINIDRVKLQNYFKSSILILEFITNEIKSSGLTSEIYKEDKLQSLNYKTQINIETENYTNKQKQIPHYKKSITTFKWKSKLDYPYSTILWQMLKDAKFISDFTVLDDFNNAFNGTILERPLMIKWTAKSKNNQINKHLLFYLLNQLADNNLIDDNTDNSTFIKRIGLIFCKQDSTKILHLKVSNTTSSNKDKTKDRLKSKDEIIIDDIMDQLLQLTVK